MCTVQLINDRDEEEKESWLFFINCRPDILCYVNFLWFFLTMTWVGLQSVIVVLLIILTKLDL